MNRYLEGGGYDPFFNLAVEEALFEGMNRPEGMDGGACLYLWQNRNTVVIGRNQNAWAECRVPLLESEGGALARRTSGGGAVYHDLGNLNFSFIVNRRDYAVSRQLSVLAEALRGFGVDAEPSGRNDLVLAGGGEKFSGSAFRIGEYACLHHGTILIDVDMERLSRLLAPSAEKLSAKGVGSVRARVTNLSALCPELTVSHMKAALLEAFERAYGPARTMSETEIDAGRVKTLTERNASWDWRFGKSPVFDLALSKRFDWGGAELLLHFHGGTADTVRLYTDSLDETLSGTVETLLAGAPCSAAAMRDRLAQCASLQAADIGVWLGTLEL